MLLKRTFPAKISLFKQVSLVVADVEVKSSLLEHVVVGLLRGRALAVVFVTMKIIAHCVLGMIKKDGVFSLTVPEEEKVTVVQIRIVEGFQVICPMSGLCRGQRWDDSLPMI